MSAYREQAERPEYEEEKPAVLCGTASATKVGNGFIYRDVPCEVPGWWGRFFGKVKHKDIWQCGECQKKYTWNGYADRWEPVS